MHGIANSSLTPEERARVMEIQDRLIELYIDHGEALSMGDSHQADALQHEIDYLRHERKEIEVWASSAAK
jgi:hypothetical protein